MLIGPLLFNIFINDLFFADDNKLYRSNKNLENLFFNLKWDLKSVLQWFRINSLKANPGKFQFMVLGTGKLAPIN